MRTELAEHRRNSETNTENVRPGDGNRGDFFPNRPGNTIGPDEKSWKMLQMQTTIDSTVRHSHLDRVSTRKCRLIFFELFSVRRTHPP